MSRRSFSLARASLRNPSLLMLIAELRKSLQGSQTVLEVGCGNCSALRFVEIVHLTGVDGYTPALQEARRNGTHDEYAFGDVKRIQELFNARRFDACVSLDVIEHLPKEDGWRMAEAMEHLAERQV